MTRRPIASRRAFTLLEVLVSVTILVVLVTLLGAMLGSVTTAWEQEGARSERRTTARRALDAMARDLAVAALPLNHGNTNSLQFVIDPTATGLSAYALPHAFYWQAPVATSTTSTGDQGNLAILGYFVRWVGTEAILCRPLINPSSGTPAGADYQIYTNPASWLTPTLLDTYAPASKANSYEGMAGENVLGLWLQALDGNGNPITRTAAGATTPYATGAYDSRLGYSVVSTSGGSTVTSVYGPSALPAAVRIGLVVIDSRTAKRLASAILPHAATGDFFGDMQTFLSSLPATIRTGAESFTEVVSLPRTPQ